MNQPPGRSNGREAGSNKEVRPTKQTRAQTKGHYRPRARHGGGKGWDGNENNCDSRANTPQDPHASIPHLIQHGKVVCGAGCLAAVEIGRARARTATLANTSPVDLEINFALIQGV